MNLAVATKVGSAALAEVGIAHEIEPNGNVVPSPRTRRDVLLCHRAHELAMQAAGGTVLTWDEWLDNRHGEWRRVWERLP